MPSCVHCRLHDRVALITIDNPPLNVLGPGVLDAVADEVARAESNPDVEAIVLTGAGKTFVAGADIALFDQIVTREQSIARSQAVHARLRAIEDARKPVVAAIHGHALGGGLELAMACHYRVVDEKAMLGQPEVQLGLIPGAASTQRLPRLCGPAAALDLCTTGQPIPAARAQALGIVDAIARGNLLDEAIAFARARAGAGERRRTRELTHHLENRDAGRAACEAARASLASRGRGARAACAVIDAIEACVTRDFESGSRREMELFADCVLSTESKALRHLFFAERQVSKVPGIPRDLPAPEIRRAAVIGAGTMGRGIAMCYANAGIPVLLKEVDPAALAAAMTEIRRTYESSVSKGRLAPDAMQRALGLITPVTEDDGLGEVDIVTEAVFEDLALKKDIFAALGRTTHPGCILASNTSMLDIDALAEASGRPDHVVGHHFFSPAHIMKLLEIVRGRSTRPEVLASSLALARRLGKIGVVVGNCTGFVANRLLGYYRREAYLLLEEGASVEQNDGALVAFGMPVGPFGMQDIAGLDVGWRIQQQLKAMGKTRAEGPESRVPDRLYEMGRYGQKTGAGWYRYEPGSRRPIPDPLVDHIAAEEAARRGVVRRRVSDDEIVARVMTAVINEAARVLDEGHALRASDIDVIYVHGFGFPRDRGGPMFYADTVGLPTVLARVRQYRDRFGEYWRPAPLLERLVAEGRGFHS
jgi:3-hydroxyacyl-CoA dehydrogenase